MKFDLSVFYTATQSPYQTGPETASDFLNRAKMDVKALVFEFDRPSEPTLKVRQTNRSVLIISKVFTNTNTYYLSATVRKPPEISRVVHSQPGEFDSSVSSFRDFDMRVPGQSDADTLSRGDSMEEDLSDVTLVAKPVKTCEVTPRLYNINGLWSKLTPVNVVLSEHCPECGLDITRPGHPVLSDVSISSAGRTSKSLSDNDATLCSL
ncbi:hypothetical protein FGIG_07311 [Fasciola gigantica]|uniref:Uncharacterized protein n=1 Tax=Fasciola gigantica TaxID=46835 RepID=A0A504YP23_FASGI|nr:hypothetical protein FGIG_07311 [Fasciola gigantica]